MKKNKKGFTLAELLVVVAIIAVLVAIAIPVFSAATTKAKQAADVANVRAAYAQAVTNHLVSNTAYPSTYSGTINYSGNLVWTKTSTGGLSITYTGDKLGSASPVHLTADVLS